MDNFAKYTNIKRWNEHFAQSEWKQNLDTSDELNKTITILSRKWGDRYIFWNRIDCIIFADGVLYQYKRVAGNFQEGLFRNLCPIRKGDIKVRKRGCIPKKRRLSVCIIRALKTDSCIAERQMRKLAYWCSSSVWYDSNSNPSLQKWESI